MRCATLLFVCSTLLAICAFGAEAKPRPPADAAPALELLPNGTVPTSESSESSGRIVCFGDSWAAFACDSLASAVALAGKKNKVTNRGVPGSTATMWASNTNAMLAQIVAEGIPDYIWLSIGGNDILDGNAQHKCNGSAEGQSYCNLLIFNAMTTMLDAIYKELPFVQIVIFGYDFTNFVYNAECQALALYEFGTQYGNQYDINTIFLGYAEDVLVSLQADYNPLLFQYIPMWGTLQEAGGSQYTPPPYPNTMYPSPEYLMDDGCIHASKEGWSILMTQLYKLYFASRI